MTLYNKVISKVLSEDTANDNQSKFGVHLTENSEITGDMITEFKKAAQEIADRFKEYKN